MWAGTNSFGDNFLGMRRAFLFLKMMGAGVQRGRDVQRCRTCRTCMQKSSSDAASEHMVDQTYSMVGPNIFGPNPNPLAMLNTFDMSVRDGCLGWRVRSLLCRVCVLWGSMTPCLQRDMHALRVTCIAQ